MTLPSWLPEMIRRPSGLKATAITGFSWPANISSLCPLSAFFALELPGVEQREFDVAKGRRPGQEIIRLEDEADLLVSDPGELVLVELRNLDAIEEARSSRRAVEAAHKVHEGRLA